MKVTDKYVFFWQAKIGQWTLRDIIIDGITFNCCEQWMMYAKAILFNDKVTAEKILKEKDPKQQKSLGREVKNFDIDIWEENAKKIVYKGNYAKFTQHKDLKELLLSYGNRDFVEASPFDAVWGIKMRDTDPGVEDKRNWKGKNWLGEVLTELRNDLKNETT